MRSIVVRSNELDSYMQDQDQAHTTTPLSNGLDHSRRFRQLGILALSASAVMFLVRAWTPDDDSLAVAPASEKLLHDAAPEGASPTLNTDPPLVADALPPQAMAPSGADSMEGEVEAEYEPVEAEEDEVQPKVGRLGGTGSGYSVKGRGIGGKAAERVARTRQGTGARHRGGAVWGGLGARPMARLDGAFEVGQAKATQLIQSSETRFSTISTDVDTAAYARMRSKIIDQRSMVPSAVRVEEFINYFNYDIPDSTGTHPIGIVTESGPAPWDPKRVLLRVGVKAKEKADALDARKNLVFLLDTSGSMSGAAGLDLVKYGLTQLLETLAPQDRVAIVVYAGSAGVVLPSTQVRHKSRILQALEKLEAGGSTNGGAGLELAYKIARKHYAKGGVNRVILATDGDFNVGIRGEDSLTEYVEKKRKLNIYLSVLGFSAGHESDRAMEQLADQGNGNYAYIDSPREAKRVLLAQAQGTLSPVADDVKIQVEFDPKLVSGHRVIGYKNRRLSKRDFMDDKKDAGDMGAGQSATALYELELTALAKAKKAPSLAKVSVRYRPFNQRKHRMFRHSHATNFEHLDDASDDFRFSASLAQFGRVLSHNAPKDALGQVHRMAMNARGRDSSCERGEFVELVKAYACSEGVIEAKTWTKVQGCQFGELRRHLSACRVAPEPQAQAPIRPQTKSVPKVPVTPETRVSPKDEGSSSPFRYLAAMLEFLAAWLRALPPWAALVPGALGLGLWWGNRSSQSEGRATDRRF